MGQRALPGPTNRIKIILQAIAALLGGTAIVTVGIAIGTAVAILIASLVVIAFAVLFVRGILYRFKSPDRS
jgi:hypothetical protein